ncbi:MATE family efflux transporter [Natronorubrum sp. JWXQ-INN-674]|uniref:MATE family efflux transporter n=1 Tax=Natronorubrum halalkaliphilum TaxID=2691917 RepID=A0A6B0VGS8_9EURY|nr:MATE family efflux transporter [Natronorubrum halalkaliphilum]MXV60740.1 MATE family efflux transporter [Natronorubrum halalkaliphilum]
MSEKTDRSVNVTDGDLFKPLALLSAPIVFSQLLQVGYNLADTFWVGRLGNDAVAALSYSWAIVFLMVSVGGGLTVAGTVLIAQHKGAGDITQSSHVAGQTLSFVTVVAVAFGALGYVLSPWMIQLVGAEPGSDAFVYAVTYTRIIFVGVCFMFWFFIFDALSRGWGDTRTPLYLMGISVALNVVIDPVLILGFSENPLFAWLGLTGLETTLYDATGFEGYGVAGAAIATVFSRGIAAGVGLYLLFSGRVGLEPSLSDLRLRSKTVRKIIDIGAPTATEQGVRAFGITVLTALIALAGTDAVAAYGIVNRLSSLLFLPALGLARGTETVVGQNLGAQQVGRAKQAVKLSSVLIVSIFVVVIAIAYPLAEPITAVFIEGEEAAQVVEYGAAYILIAGPSYVFLGVFQVLLGGLRGSGSTRAAMLLSIQELWLYRIPIAAVALIVFDMGVIGVWYAIAISYVLSAITTAAWFLRGTWTDDVITDDSPAPTPGD